MKEDLALLKFDSLGSGDALAFTVLYLRNITLLVEVWEHLHLGPANGLSSCGTVLQSKLQKLDRRAKEFLSRFVGFTAEEELNILELILVTYALSLYKVETSCLSLTLERLTAIYLRFVSILKEKSSLPSNFVAELGKLLHECTSTYEASCSPLELDKCLKLFSLKQFMFHGGIRHVKAELSIPNNDSEHHLTFVSGLPVGIQCEITLHNVLCDSRLWLRMSVDDGSTQYVFLDLDRFEGSREVRKLAFVAPFYRTPKANSLKLKVSIGLECMFENVCPVQRFGGPKHELVLLCKEKQVYLSKVCKD